MKRFWTEATIAPVEAGWQVLLDGRPVKTQAGSAQVVPSEALAAAMAAEWTAQGATVNPDSLPLRDLADLAIDVIAPVRDGTIAALLRYAETDTLCYRAEPDEPLHARQLELWEPLLLAAEARWDVHFERVNGVLHRPQSSETLARIERVLTIYDPFTLAALTTLSALAASLVIALAALEDGADATELWNAAELEEDWQAELWGTDAEAAERRARRFAMFSAAQRFAALAKG
jgi:chaperone required for assembly of F1-ATPase